MDKYRCENCNKDAVHDWSYGSDIIIDGQGRIFCGKIPSTSSLLRSATMIAGKNLDLCVDEYYFENYEYPLGYSRPKIIVIDINKLESKFRDLKKVSSPKGVKEILEKVIKKYNGHSEPFFEAFLEDSKN